MKFLKKIVIKLSLPLLIGLIYTFLYIPIIVLIIFSFNSAQFPAPWASFSLRWYQELFFSGILWKAFANSVIIAFSSTFLSISLTLGVIYYQVMGGKLDKFLYLFYINAVIPELVLAVGLLILLTYLQVPLGLFTLIVAHTVLGIGFVMPILYARYAVLDQRLLEASLDLGATRTQTFWKIILPLLTPALIASALLVFMISFDDFVLSFFCAGSEAQTLSLYIYSMIRSGVSPIVNALSTVLLLISTLIVAVFSFINIKTKIF